ncbi:ROK family protein [Anoxybacterium hadale]|uniref:ROK family protein n=1 Tax=Anoxybacterium hadale TaxID=3408580 RepID=UPI003B00801D
MIGAIDIGGTKTMTAVLSDAGSIIESRYFPTVSKDWREHFKITADAFQRCAQPYLQELVGVGINVPGMADSQKGTLIYAPHQNWKDIPVAEYFRNAIGIGEVIVENDVNSCAIGEMVFGGGGTDFLWITVSTGNGGAIVANGKLIRGVNHCAGEFGHLKVEFEHPRKCTCGQLGCLESQSSGTAIRELFRERLMGDSALLALVQETEAELPDFQRDARGLSILAERGSETAREIFWTAGRYLGRAISYGLNLTNPQRVYLGGGVAKSLPLLLPAIREEIRRNAVLGAADVEIMETKLGYHAALLGAGALILQGR